MKMRSLSSVSAPTLKLRAVSFKDQTFCNTTHYSENLIVIPGSITTTVIDIDKEVLLFQDNQRTEQTSTDKLLKKTSEDYYNLRDKKSFYERSMTFLTQYFTWASQVILGVLA